MPDLFPCKVTVTNGSNPISGATVNLGLISESSMCVMTGTTDSSGVATIHTKRQQWQGAGAPAGEYNVAISKLPKLEGGLSVEEYQQLTPEEQEKYQIDQQRKYDALPREIPVELGEFDKTPYRLTVSKGGENSLTIDISKKSE